MNEDEAARARGIFEVYLEHQSLIATVQELARRGWTNKRWTTREGRVRGGGRGRGQRLNVAATGANVAQKKAVAGRGDIRTTAEVMRDRPV